VRDPRIREVVVAAYLAALVACAAPPAREQAASPVAPAPLATPKRITMATMMDPSPAWNAHLWDVR
jgi:hypothetical protein